MSLPVQLFVSPRQLNHSSLSAPGPPGETAKSARRPPPPGFWFHSPFRGCPGAQSPSRLRSSIDCYGVREREARAGTSSTDLGESRSRSSTESRVNKLGEAERRSRVRTGKSPRAWARHGGEQDQHAEVNKTKIKMLAADAVQLRWTTPAVAWDPFGGLQPSQRWRTSAVRRGARLQLGRASGGAWRRLAMSLAEQSRWRLRVGRLSAGFSFSRFARRRLWGRLRPASSCRRRRPRGRRASSRCAP